MNTAKLHILPDLAKLALAHSKLREVSAPKVRYILEDHDFDPLFENDSIAVCYYPRGTSDFTDQVILMSDLLEFVEMNYRTGEYDQRSNYQYFEENVKQVLTDYINQ